MSVSFKPGFGAAADTFIGRMFLVYAIDKDGNWSQAKVIRYLPVIYLDGEMMGYQSPMNEYMVILGRNGSRKWSRSWAFSADIEIKIQDGLISDGPALAVQAGNYAYYGNSVLEITGAAYFSPYDVGGNCKVVDPEAPAPPLDIAIDMTAPNWNLGELPRGDSEKIFPEVANQLCFTYSGPTVKGKNFVINASNANGVAANRYRLKNVADATQLIPYAIKFDSGTSTFSLPDASNTALPFDSSGKTCFVPTFRTSVDAKVKEGDYSDVLTFTVVVKP